MPARALDPGKTLTQYAHRIWGQEEGLFQPTVYSILQTRDGFVWLGTQDSLIRFDGVHFREFRDGNSFLHGSLIHSLLEDPQGNLWVGSVGSGVARISPDGSVTRYTAEKGLPTNNAICLDLDSKNGVWACTDRGLVRIDANGVRTFTTANGLPSDGIRSTCQAADGTRWVAGIDSGLSRWNGSRFEAYSSSLLGPKERITALHCARDGSVWLGASGLVHITAQGSRRFTTRDGLPDNDVSSLAEGADGSLWVGTNDGISRIRNGAINVYRTRDGLSHSLVLSLYVDREGSLWAGTKDGLDQFTDGKVTPYTTTDGLLSNDSGPVIEDAAGRLWIGTLGKGLNSFDGSRFRAVTTADGLIDDTVLSLERDPGGDLWVGTKKGVSRLRNGVPIAAYTTAGGLSGPEVRALFVDSQGVLWAGTNHGLDYFDGHHFAPADVIPDSDRTRDNGTGVVALDGGRTVRLFASVDAAGLYLLRDNRAASFPLDITHPIDCYFLDYSRHTTWMGTLGSGLLRWKNGAIAHVRVKDGLYDNRIYEILRDDNANFWLASSKGIFRVSQQELEDFADGKRRTVTSIPFSTGQLRFECRAGVQPAACRTHDGRLWFSTTNGLVVVDPNHLLSNTIPPPAAITAVIVNGQRVEPHGELHLKPADKTNLEIRYAGLSFISPEKVTFRYRLEGYDKAWTDAASRREAFFTNLPPGSFRFEVMARNADGIWSAKTAALGFIVEPKFYQHRWFFPLLAAVLGLLTAAWYRLRIRRLRQSFDLVLAERSRIARELHDTLLQGLSGITMQMQALWTRLPPSKEKTFLGEVIQDAGQCSMEARQSLWGLRTHRAGGSFEFSEKLENLARQSVRGSSIKLVLDIERVSLRSAPEIEFQLLRIAQEVLSNALKHSQAFLLTVGLEVRNGTLLLTCEDDGIGFVETPEATLGHFGLVGIRERAEEIGAEVMVASSLERGTRVSVSLRLKPAVVPAGNVVAPLEHQTK
ncbi:MAG: hypothetical protein JOY54_07235 [Acidobacteriaceae bacterium]|nr:hypothetical protein [Acidobacteriaceae bacterium]